ncbi:MAG: tol-pal system protein YbgF [Rhodospirillales bacterium]
MNGKVMRSSSDRRCAAWRPLPLLVALLLALHAHAAAQMPAAGGADAGSGTPPAVARLDSRITQLEQDVRSVTGRVESLSHQVRQLNDKLDKLSSDLDMRLDQGRGTGSGVGGGAAVGMGAGAAAGAGLGAGAASPGPRVLGRGNDEPAATTAPPASVPSTAGTPAAPAETRPQQPPPQQQAALPQGSSKDQYAAAFALMQKGNYAAAGEAFSDFLSRYPDDSLADNARYWLGESYYARGDYTRAAQTFFEAYDKNKSGPKAPDTLLKLGMALGNLDKKKEACASFRELGRTFPNASAAIKDKAAQESRRIGCG